MTVALPPSRVIVVTGSSSGIGQSIAIRFAAPNVALFVHGHKNAEGIAKSIQLATQKGATACSHLANIADPIACDGLVNSVFERFGRVDVWINAAGADVLTGDSKQLSFDDKLDLLWKTDVAGTIRISRSVAQLMSKQAISPEYGLPTILNLSWDQAEMGMEGDSGQYFSAVKSAIAAFSKSLAKSVGPRVRVNCIAPGWIQTAWGNSASPAWSERAQGESILHRWGTAEDIANVAWMLASKECEFINGQTVPVNGGWKPNYQ